LQTRALPLGYGAMYGIFRRGFSVYAFNKNNIRGDVVFIFKIAQKRITGIEPATSTLARLRSTK
jgi:hypothetical protein